MKNLLVNDCWFIIMFILKSIMFVLYFSEYFVVDFFCQNRSFQKKKKRNSQHVL